MKKIQKNFLIVTIFLLEIFGIYKPVLRAMETNSISASELTASDKITNEILYIIHTFLTPTNIQDLFQKKLVNDKTTLLILNDSNILREILPKADKDFGNVPGFQAYKKKILNFLRNFIVGIDFDESNRFKERAIILSSIDELKCHIDKLDFDTRHEFKNIPFDSTTYAQWIKERYPIDRKNPGWDYESCKEKHVFFNRILGLKLGYLKYLALLSTLDSKEAETYENEKLGLTCENSHALMQGTRKIKIQKCDVKKIQKEQPEYFNGLAHTLHCILYELEAAFVAQSHGEKIIAFGPTLTLVFDLETQKDLIVKILDKNNTFLKPVMTPKKCTLTQEFDLVTTEKIIECKNLNNGGMDTYLNEFLRQQFMVTYATKARYQNIDLGGDKLPIADLAHKPVVCYARYIKNFLKEEKRYQDGRRSETPQLQQEMLNLETLNEPKLTQSELHEIQELVLRTCKESRHRESKLVSNGFSYWNGCAYHHVEKIMHSYEVPGIAEIIALKKFIQVIGHENFALHIIAPPVLHQNIKDRLDHFGIRAKAKLKHKRSHSDELTNNLNTQLQSPTSSSEGTRSQPQSPVSESTGYRSQSPLDIIVEENDQNLQKLGKLHFLRKQLSLKIFNFSIPESDTFDGLPKRPKPYRPSVISSL